MHLQKGDMDGWERVRCFDDLGDAQDTSSRVEPSACACWLSNVHVGEEGDARGTLAQDQIACSPNSQKQCQYTRPMWE